MSNFRKIRLFQLSLLACIIVSGCTNVTQDISATGNTSKIIIQGEYPKNSAQQKIIPSPTNIEPSYKKYRVGTDKIDEMNIITKLIDNFDDALIEGTPSNKKITIDENTFEWGQKQNYFYYKDDVEIVPTDDEEIARNVADKFLGEIGICFDSYAIKIIKSQNGLVSFEYTPQIDGVSVMGNRIITLPDRETDLSGAIIAVTADKKRVHQFDLLFLYNNISEIQEYKTDDFIKEPDITEYLAKYFKGFYQSDVDINNISIDNYAIIYMPYLEQGEKVLIPVYSVNCSYKNKEYSVLVDVITGYVYDSNTIR